MNPLESQLRYPLGDQLPARGQCIEVAPGVKWIRMALPFALDHINLWLLRDDAGWTAVDCGVSTEETQAAWQEVFDNVLEGWPIVRVLATHYHPDHIGLAYWLCEKWNAPLTASLGEYGFARILSAALPGTDVTIQSRHYQQHGLVRNAATDAPLQKKSHYPTHVPQVPSSFIRLHEGDQVRIGEHVWQVIIGIGHSPEHVALYCAALGVLISGDMVLPRISTNVSVFELEPENDALRHYLHSLKKFLPLPEDTLVLPSHGKPFLGLHVRIAQLEAHHAERLAEVMDACAQPKSAADIVPIMFKRALDAHQMGFAMGEALAHLHLLWHEGKLRRQHDADGITRFVTNRA